MCCGAKVEKAVCGVLFRLLGTCRKSHFKNFGMGYLGVTGKRYAKLA
jgi:hypothetical protein